MKNCGSEKILTYFLIVFLADTILGGPIGLFFRGERHLILAFIVMLGLYLWFKKQIQLPHKKIFMWRSYLLWPLWFFLVSLIWVFAVPVSVGGSLVFALEDAQSLLLLPVASLMMYVLQDIKTSKVLLLTVVWTVTVLAVLQVGIWLWLEFFPTTPENYYHYVQAIFNTKDSIFIFWQPSASGGYVRIFWISSIWLAIAVFVTPIVVKKRWVVIVEFILVFAICASYTRGLWLGVGAGMLLCTMVNYIVLLKKNQVPMVVNWGRALIGMLCAVVIFSSVDYFVRGQAGLFSRLDFITEASKSTEASLTERKIQSRMLLRKWQERPWMGFGYGAYIIDHHSVDSRPYLYEMMPFALLMKLGVIGFLLYLAAILGLLLSIVKVRANPGNKLMFSGAIIAFFLVVNTNPVLYSFVGMGAVLFILIWWAEIMFIVNDGVLFVGEVPSEADIN